MKLKTIKHIIEKHAHKLSKYAGYSGLQTDVHSRMLLQGFIEYKYNLLIKPDLRPSELTDTKKKIMRSKIQKINLEDYQNV